MHSFYKVIVYTYYYIFINETDNTLLQNDNNTVCLLHIGTAISIVCDNLKDIGQMTILDDCGRHMKIADDHSMHSIRSANPTCIRICLADVWQCHTHISPHHIHVHRHQHKAVFSYVHITNELIMDCSIL
jgi:hypothetical protein